MAEYPKPHQPYDVQLKILADRGLHYDDRPAAIRALKAIGYYRLSGYTYPLRKPGTPDSVLATTTVPRSDEFIEGATFDDALNLYRFDNALRSFVLEGLQQVEVGMRVRVGHQLGKTDKFGHLDEQYLDPQLCGAPSHQVKGLSAHEAWLEQFTRQARDAANEEYVKHFLVNYGGKMPIWVATEVMSFGCLTSLYGLLNKRDADQIAASLEIRDRSLVHKYMKSLNVLRNSCAHNGRIWNRSTVYPPKKPPVIKTNERIHHLNHADPHRLYFLLALCAEFVIGVNPESNWPRGLKTLMNKHFTTVHGMDEFNTMGFVAGWRDEPIWNYEPIRGQ